ncbi:MAG TPA: hypothetical protein VLT36_00070, partial [Candidatus Dormibacteraeota bacterium]|nr:hypothetical protein [Candidatus Dormibacteraeota bacterium]
TENHNSVSVDYGPLTFSLKIGESYERHDSIKTAIGDSHWQPGADPAKWPSFEIHPETAWNYGLMLNEKTPESSFTLKQAPWPRDNFPFTPHAAPIILEAKAKRIPEWALDRFGLCAVLQECPVRSDEPVETVSLIPMGAARLRICSFPVIGDGPDAKRWTAPVLPKASPYKASASHCFSSDTIEALADGLAPTSSADHSIPRLTWWDHCGSKEWVQYDFPNLKQLSEAEVYWFDDTGTGQCRLPQTLRVLYRDGDGNDWKPVPNPNGFAPRKDDWNRVTFDRITASALRLDVQMKPGFSGGILEWRVK